MPIDIIRCKNCVISSSFPYIKFDEEGVCSFCRDKMFFPIENEAIITAKEQMQTLFEMYKEKKGYNAIVCYSGGKDSTLTLIRSVKDYNLKILAYTLDNGFISDEAFNNMRVVLDNLGVDHIISKPSLKNFKKIIKACTLKKIFPQRTLSRISSVCNACISIVNIGAMRLAYEKNIPLIISGFTLGQIPTNSIIFQFDYKLLHESRKETIKRLIMEAGDFVEDYYTINENLINNSIQIPYNINPLCLESKTDDQIISEISKYGWKAPSDVDGCSSNCKLNSFNNYVHEFLYGYNPYELELSHMIRKGLITRDQAIDKICNKKEGLIKSIMNELNIMEDQLKKT